MSETMRAVRWHEYGDSSKLKVESVPRPKPEPGEILVRVRFSGVNPIDWKVRSGMYKDFMPTTFPAGTGAEFSGTVEALGSGVSGFAVGDRVFGPASGTYAELVSVPVGRVAPIPPNLSFEQAASVSLGTLTAWYAVEDAGIGVGQTVVVIGAAGGVGMYAVQLARLKGATVYGVASSANAAFVKTLGAEPVDYAAGPLTEKVHDADVVIDTVGGAALDGAFALVKRGGRLITVAGRPSEEKAKSLGITAQSSGNRNADPLPEIAKLLGTGKLVPEVGEIFPLDRAGAAQDRSQTGHGRGRILIRI